MPEPADGFHRYVTVAYRGADVPADRVQLIALRNDSRVYRWDAVASVPLGTTLHCGQ